MYIIMYDIISDRLRNRIAKKLKVEGYERIQYSVFCGLHNPEEIPQLKSDLTEWMENEAGSKLFIISVSKQRFKNIFILGTEMPDIDYLTGDKQSLFI